MQDEVSLHYDNNFIFDYESVRLTQHALIEFAVTKRYLNKLICDRAYVADIGVGTGHYAELLAKRGCNLYLIDISERLLKAAYTRLERSNLKDRVLEIHNISAIDLAPLKAEICDAVLLLGPLYHLCSQTERELAVKAALRILKPKGIIFAAGINRLAYFREQFRNDIQQVVARQEFHQKFLKDGNADPVNIPPLGYTHLTTSKEFLQLFESKFEHIVLTGVESFTAPFPTTANQLTSQKLEAWVDLVEATGKLPEGLGMSDHFLYIGRKA